MRIALIGYGKMGKLIDEVATKQGHTIAYKITGENKEEIDSIKNADVAIEFTQPDAAINNFEKLMAQNIPVVTGTTGWMNDFDKVKNLVLQSDNRFFYASNFSIGVHIALAANAYLAKIIENFQEYTARIDEWHHIQKKDAPSGTALSFANEIINNHKRYRGVVTDTSDYQEDELPIFAYRKDDIPGTHQITFESEIDSIILRHEAKNRLGFATGAIKAAEFLIQQKPGIYSMNHLIKLPL